MDGKREAFKPMKAMWWTLPGAVMCSIPIGIYVFPKLVSNGLPLMFTDRSFALVSLIMVPITFVTSRRAYNHCISTMGHPEIRAILMVFNLISLGLAVAGVSIIALAVVLVIWSLIFRQWSVVNF